MMDDVGERLKAAVGDLVRELHEEDYGEYRPLMIQDAVLIVTYTELDGDATDELTMKIDGMMPLWTLIGLLEFHLEAARGYIEHTHDDGT